MKERGREGLEGGVNCERVIFTMHTVSFYMAARAIGREENPLQINDIHDYC